MNLQCNGCENLNTIDRETDRFYCTHCGCLNQIHPDKTTSVIFNEKSIDKDSPKKIARISHDVLLYLEALAALKINYTSVLNEGITLYINQLPTETKQKIAKQIELLK
jgi:hypothetical protein